MNSIKNWTFALALLFCHQAFAQTDQTKGYCGTTERMEAYYREHPEARVAAQIYEMELQQTIQTMQANKTAIRQKYIIPVVVHVIHNNGSEKISYEQVVSEFDVLNRDYRRRPGTKGYGSGVDMEIEFSLATIDPNGNPTTGVLYVQSEMTDLWKFGRSADRQLKALSRWPPERYLNVYLVRDINQPGLGGAVTLGYCMFPGAPRDLDGAVIEHDSWGVIGKVKPTTPEGRVATHEFGHYLGLYHPFDGVTQGCGGKDCRTTGDLVCDTPPTNQQNFGGSLRKNTCNNDDPDVPDRTRNYMDYADGVVKDEFSYGQLERAQATLNNRSFKQRIDLWTEETHYMTGVGQYGPTTAEFWVDKRVACPGAPIQFVDYSNNNPYHIKWTFPGGTPATSESPNPVVTYGAPGRYDVILEVSNNVPGAEPSILERKGYIEITDETLHAPFTESFEEDFPPQGWQVVNPDSAWTMTNITFKQFTKQSGQAGAFNKSDKSAIMEFINYPSYGQLDALVSPPIDVSALEWPHLTFSYAYQCIYAEKSISGTVSTVAPIWFTDTLNVYVSEDCGATWKNIQQMGGVDLITTTDFSTSYYYVNRASDWQTMRLDLSPWREAGTIQLKFETVNGWGNNLYLDDIGVVETFSSTEPAQAATFKFQLAPNPSPGRTQVRWISSQSETALVELLDVQGRVLYARSIECLGGAPATLDLTTPASGIYVVRVTGHDWTTSQRLVADH